MQIETKYIPSQKVDIRITRYSNNRPAIQIFSKSGEPLMKVTVNLPDIPLLPDDVAIKNYSENEGILDELIRLNVIKDTGMWVKSGFVNIPICTLNSEKEWHHDSDQE